MTARSRPSGDSATRVWAWLLVGAALLANAVLLWPEHDYGGGSPNDSAYHVALAARLADAVERGEDPLDCWVSEWSFGYPLPRTYQVLGHLTVALVHLALRKSVSIATIFGWARYLVIAALPLSVYAAARLLTFRPMVAACSALVAPLVSSPAGQTFGVEYGSYVFSGSGLFTQALAVPITFLAVGLGFHAIQTGRRLAASALVLALAFLSHFVYGYVGALSLCLLAVLPDPSVPRRTRALRLAVIGCVSAALTAPTLLHIVKDGPLLNRSRLWGLTWWWDSFGAREVMGRLLSGELLDHGRAPVLSLLALAGLGVLAASFAPRFAPVGRFVESPLAQRFVAAGFIAWLLHFFGRPTWGRLLDLLDKVHLHRLVGGVHIFAILLAGVGLAAVADLAVRRAGLSRGLAVLLVVPAVLLPAWRERSRFLSASAEMSATNSHALAAASQEVSRLIDAAREQHGRVWAGPSFSWGRQMTVGWTPVYGLLAAERVPSTSFLYHAMALTAEVLPLFDERNPAHYRLFNVAAVVAPRDRGLPGFLKPVLQAGRFQLSAAPEPGYFDLVSVLRSAPASETTFRDLNAAWLKSGWPARGAHVRLDLTPAPRLPPVGTEDFLVSPEPPRPLGRVLWEHRDGEVYGASVEVLSPCHLLFKMTYHPGWRVVVDGEELPAVMLTPGFLGVALRPGKHDVTCRYVPEKGHAALLVLGLGVLALALAAEARGWLERIESALGRPGSGRLDGGAVPRGEAFGSPSFALEEPGRFLLPPCPLPAGLSTAAVLAAGFTCLYLAAGPGNFFSVDEVVVEETASAVADRAAVDIPSMNTSRAGRAGSFYSNRGPGLGFTASPAVLIGDRLDGLFGSLAGGVLQGPPRGVPEHPLRWGGRLSLGAAIAVNAAIGGAIVATLFLVALRLGSSRKAALVLAAAAGLATPLFSESTHFFQHPLEALGLLLAVYFLAPDGSGRPGGRCALGGLALGLAVLARPNAALAVPLLGAAGLAGAWRDVRGAPGSRGRLLALAAALAAGPAIAAALLLHYNNLRFGGPFRFGYTAEAERFLFDPLQIAKTFAGYLISPSLSLPLFAPPLLLGLLGARKALSRYRPWALAAMSSALVYVAFFSLYRSWHGALAFGPRFLLGPLLLLILLALPAVEEAVQAPAGLEARWLRLLVASGLLVELLGISIDVVTNEWQRVWLGVEPDGRFVFVAAASPLWTHLRDLLFWRNLSPWLLRAFARPGLPLGFGIGLLLIAAMSAWWLAESFRAGAPESRVPSSPSRLPAVILGVLLLLVGAGFIRARAVDETPAERASRFLNEGLLAQRKGDAVKASERYALVLSLQPRNPWGLFYMGVVHQTAGQRDTAARLYQRALAVRPDFPEARRSLARLRAGAHRTP